MTGKIVESAMNEVQSWIESDVYKNLISSVLALPKTFIYEVTEDEMVNYTRYVFAIMVQEMNKIETLMENNQNYTQSAQDFLGQWGIDTSQNNFAVTDLFDFFGGMRKKRSLRVRRNTCTCSGYNGSHFFKSKKNLMTACVGVAGFVQFL